MLVVEPGESLKHIQTRKILPGSESSLGLGSDGETSDYQRSTPSPGDTNDRITEVTEGLEKADSLRESSPQSPDSWKPSPDLGFVDYVEVPFSDCHPRLSLAGGTQVNKVKNVTESSKIDPDTANILLSKSLKVDVEKLPTVMTSMVTSKNHPSLMFKRTEGSASVSSTSRKRYAGVLGNNQRSASKKCPRLVSVDQRKTSLNKTIPGSKELLFHPNLFNSFRITKPKSNLKCEQGRPTRSKSAASKTNGVNGIHLETQTFYKQSDLVQPPTSVTSSTVFSTSKTESKEHFSSKINFLDDKNDSENSTEGSQETVQDIIKPSQDRGDKSCHSEAVTHSEEAIFALPNPKKIRFPAVPFSSAIQCKWEGCGECFKTHAKLSDHIKTTHVVGEEAGDSIKYSCRWVGCKVFGKKSSCKSWLERHVPRHGSKFTYDCIVEGCRMRFSSQAMLERHVNSHFPESSSKQNNSAQSGPRKSIEGVTAKKRLKRAGVRLKFRQLPFSARIFDFFDAGLMSGIRHYNSQLQKTSSETFNVRTDSIEFHSKIISIRKDETGSRQVQLKWIPEDLLEDQWVPLHEVTATKTVKISNLPEKSKQKLNHQLLFQPERKKQSRKTKRQDLNNLFLTPAEVRLKEAERSGLGSEDCGGNLNPN